MDPFYAQIESYLLGELSGPELEAFENALRRDPDLARALAQHSALQQRLQGLRLRKKVSAALQQSRRQRPESFPGFQWALQAAAAVVLLAIAAWFFIDHRPKTPENVVLEQPDPGTLPSTPRDSQSIPPLNTRENAPSPAPESTLRYAALAREFYVAPTADFIRSANDPPAAKSALEEAIAAFDQKDYRRAARLLENDASLGADDSGRFLRAHARFQLGRFREAAADFSRLQTSFQYQHEARWNLLLCAVARGNGRDAATKASLDSMVSDPDFPFQPQAVALQKKLVLLHD